MGTLFLKNEVLIFILYLLPKPQRSLPLKPMSAPAGRNVRAIEARRRLRASQTLRIALGLGMLPLVVEISIWSLATLVGPDVLSIMLFHRFLLYGLCGLTALRLWNQGQHWQRRANHAAQGAAGEEAVGTLLAAAQGQALAHWRIEYGVRLGSGRGDVDVICTAPSGQVFAIDVKSHRGQVVSDGQRLLRQWGNHHIPFEKNFLAQVKGQAVQVKRCRQTGFVIPIVVFSQARVALRGRLQGVYVVEKRRLVTLLTQLA